MKVGRNDLCSCGSGKKYKHCCLPREAAPSPDEVAWRRVKRATEGLASALLRTAKSHFGRTALDEAWEAFNLWEIDEPFDPDTPYVQVFMPWFFYDWLPERKETEVPASAHGTTAAQAYLQSAEKRLDPLTARYIEAALAAPFSFHEVVDCTPGRGFRLRDVLLGSETAVIEHSGSTHAIAGDLLYTKVVPIDGIAVLEGCTPVAIPPVYEPELIAFRAKHLAERERPGSELLRECAIELRDLYLAFADRQLYPEPPQMANTDGEPFELRTLVYDIDSPREAFDALKDLAAGMPEDEILGGAEFDAAGTLVRAKIDWRKKASAENAMLEHVTLGTIRIELGRLEADVNSAQRDERLRKLTEERLGERARFRVAKVQSVESILGREPTAAEQAAARERKAESARLSERPEVRAAMTEMLRRHYRAWLDDRIPALGNRTPREAVKDPDGREAVEALIAQIERDGVRMTPALDPGIVKEMREALGLATPDEQ
jgi:hypothetical protein